MRILLYNAAYATGLDGSIRDYLLKFHRYIYTPRNIIRRVRQAIYHLLERETPDVCCFVEVHSRTHMLPESHAYAYGDIENKYGRFSWLRALPMFRDNCNGFLSKKPLPYRKHEFTHGTKKLIYEILLKDDLSLFLVHFSLNGSVRREQCRELVKLLSTRPRVILCGDFNIFRGAGELQQLAKDCNLHIVNDLSQATFPTFRPRQSLDLFLCSHSLKQTSVKVLHAQASDHLPVLLDVQA